MLIHLDILYKVQFCKHTHTIVKACLLTLTDKQARIHICTVTLSKNFCGRKQGV